MRDGSSLLPSAHRLHTKYRTLTRAANIGTTRGENHEILRDMMDLVCASVRDG